MKVGIISDVHCQHEALALTAKALVAEGVEEILLPGDSHYEYRFSNEVVEVTQEYGMRYVLGNHETMLIGPHGARAVAAPHVRAANLEFVRATSHRIITKIAGKTLTMVHANPFAQDNTYLYSGNALFSRIDELDTDYLVLGHTHVPMVERLGRTLVLNPGSLVFSRDPGSEGTITYLVLDTDSDEVRTVRTTRSELERKFGVISS
jgi:putative phosphoesterase